MEVDAATDDDCVLEGAEDSEEPESSLAGVGAAPGVPVPGPGPGPGVLRFQKAKPRRADGVTVAEPEGEGDVETTAGD